MSVSILRNGTVDDEGYFDNYRCSRTSDFGTTLQLWYSYSYCTATAKVGPLKKAVDLFYYDWHRWKDNARPHPPGIRPTHPVRNR